MGTRSTIAIQNQDGSVTGIYCHWDGYLEHNGRILHDHYTTEEIVRELISLGELSSLGTNIGTKHDFDNAPRNECNAYGRDRGEKGVDAVTFHTWNQMLNEQRQSYNYLFVHGEGWYFDRNGPRKLSEALNG